MKENIGVLAPGKGWGNFVSFISVFKKISEKRNKKIILITKRISSAKSYLHDQGFVKKFYEIENSSKGYFKKIIYIINLYKILKEAQLTELFIFHSSFILVFIAKLAKIKNIYAPGTKLQSILLNKKNKLYENSNSNKIESIDETIKLTCKILKLDKIDFKPLEYIQKVDNYKIGICIASSGYEKQWGIEKYLQLINYLIKKGYNKFLLLSGMDQNADEKKLISHFNKNIYFETTSTNTIKEVIPKLKRCKFVIGNDTGFSHLSVAYNKKTYVILGDCPPHKYSNLFVTIDKNKHIKRNSNSINTIKLSKVLSILKD